MSEYTVSDATQNDAVAIGPMHLKSWHETYINHELGINSAFINEKMGKVAKEEGNEFRRKRIAEAQANPEKVMYKVVKNKAGEVVGFFIAEKIDEFNDLQAIYLLDSAKGSGIANELMDGFLAWLDPAKPSKLAAAAYNDRALRFYQRYGFAKTDKELPLHHDKMPTVEMVRPADK
ncbi:GNAT family N-acetyltransferase [Candidatus Saccharibacteria bacterium]|nr:GNAT family N-acetyltransferase [Candidatus Saccharibacteria bacterium]